MDERMIACLGKHEWLYDPKHGQYKNAPMKNNAWTEIAQVLECTGKTFMCSVKVKSEAYNGILFRKPSPLIA